NGSHQEFAAILQADDEILASRLFEKTGDLCGHVSKIDDLHGLYLSPLGIQFTTLVGLPSRKATRLSTVARNSRCRASWVAQAMWGVIRQRGAVNNGLSARIGSVETTSTAAPARRPLLRASTRSSSTTRPPRAVLMSRAPGLSRCNRSRLTSPAV